MAINLLPTEKKQSKDTQRSVQLLTRIAIAVGVIVIIEGIAGVAALYFLNTKLTQVQQKHDSTVAQISALEATEQGLVLVKDRLQKVQTVLADRATYTNLEKLNKVVNGLTPDTAKLDKIELTSSGSKLTLGSTNSNELKNLVNQMGDSSIFSSSVIRSLSFSPLSGFEIEFDAN